MYSRLSPACAWSCNLARACTPGLRTQRAAARKHRHSRLLARWSRTTPTRQGALHDPSIWAPRRRPVDDGRLRRCRERGRNPVLKSGHPRCWRSEECRRIAHEAATKAAAMPKAATGKAGSRSDDASRPAKTRFMIAIPQSRPPDSRLPSNHPSERRLYLHCHEWTDLALICAIVSRRAEDWMQW
jgi:hypothetical protein